MNNQIEEHPDGYTPTYPEQSRGKTKCGVCYNILYYHNYKKHTESAIHKRSLINNELSKQAFKRYQERIKPCAFCGERISQDDDKHCNKRSCRIALLMKIN